MAEEFLKHLEGSIEDVRKLVIETNASLREMRGEMKEFKEHVIGRVGKLEKNEGERSGKVKSTVGVVLSAVAICITIIVNFFRHGGR
jgi:phage-related protein